MSIVVTESQRHDSTRLEAVVDGIRVPRPGGVGRPRKRPDHVLADKGYSYPKCRRLLRRRGISHTIPERRDQKARRKGRPLAGDRRWRVMPGHPRIQNVQLWQQNTSTRKLTEEMLDRVFWGVSELLL